MKLSSSSSILERFDLKKESIGSSLHLFFVFHAVPRPVLPRTMRACHQLDVKIEKILEKNTHDHEKTLPSTIKRNRLTAAVAAFRVAAPASFAAQRAPSSSGAAGPPTALPGAASVPVPPPLPPTTAAGGAALAGDLLEYLDAGGDPAHLAYEFDALAAWSDRSLDAFRPELSRVLYPVFVHSYLDLVAKGQANAAAGLLSRHKARFGGGGDGDGEGEGGTRNEDDDDDGDDESERIAAAAPSVRSRARKAELAALASITAPEQVAADRAVAAARDTRYPLTLCQASFDLLAGFLRSRGASLLLCLVNDRLALKVRPGQPAYARGVASAARRRRRARLLQSGGGAVSTTSKKKTKRKRRRSSRHCSPAPPPRATRGRPTRLR